MMRVVVLAPISTSLYSRIVVHTLARDSGVEVTGIVVRTPWTLNRISSEFRRDGVRLIKKVFNKWLLVNAAYSDFQGESLQTMAKKIDLPGKNLNDLARNWNIPLITVADHNDRRSQSFLEKYSPDVIVFTGGGIIRSRILDIPRIGILNCHTGLLPDYRGMDVIEWAVLENFNPNHHIGLTLHFMDKGVDSGSILLKQFVELKTGDTFESIRLRMEPMMVSLILEGIRGLQDGALKEKMQKNAEGRQYFIMHPRLRAKANQRLKDYHFKENQQDIISPK